MGSFNNNVKIDYGTPGFTDADIETMTSNINNYVNNYQEANATESVSFDISESTVDTSTNPVERVHNDLAGKTVVEDRATEGDEMFISGHITIYDDGTIVRTDVNQVFYKNTVEYISIPLEDGSGYHTILVIGPNDDGLVCIEQNDLGSFKDNSSVSVSYDVTRHYEGRDDGLVMRIDNPQNADYSTVAFYEGRSDGIVRVEHYPDKSIYYYNDGREVIK